MKSRSEVIDFIGSENNRLAATLFSTHDDGKHPPVLFMHGGGQTRHSWQNAAAQMAELGMASVTVDAPKGSTS